MIIWLLLKWLVFSFCFHVNNGLDWMFVEFLCCCSFSEPASHSSDYLVVRVSSKSARQAPIVKRLTEAGHDDYLNNEGKLNLSVLLMWLYSCLNCKYSHASELLACSNSISIEMLSGVSLFQYITEVHHTASDFKFSVAFLCLFFFVCLFCSLSVSCW